MSLRHHLAAAAAAALAVTATAQIPKDTAAPPFDFDKVWNDGPATFDEFEGRLVILDFAQTW